MKKIGIIGAGVMGRGVAYQFAKYGFEIVLQDIRGEALEQAKTDIKNTLRMDMLLNRANPKNKEVIDVIRFTADLNELAGCSFIVENIIENMDAKQALYRQLATVLDRDTVVAVNTSCISITKIASLLNDPSKVLGIHFMNPVYMKPTVEMIEGVHTSPETIAYALETLAEVDMDGIVVKDFPGFVSNRISHLLMNEAALIVQDNVATHEQIDEIFKKCFGHKMGPLETADLIGLDTVVDSLKVLYDEFQDPKFRVSPLLKKKVEAGLLGRKSGEGFYKY
ncbi:MAG: 3-hydroxyacyl-CoA dehydrogenase [Crocinitomicaceae bacterium]|nr:3-hydroxyacyl-CoA dehydrogenase [Crocinitomicaceae bacterium]